MRRTPLAPKFKLHIFTPKVFKSRTSVSNIHINFLLTDGLINQTLDKVASSQKNQDVFDPDILTEMRTQLQDVHFV